jgi:hypothetical protein
MNAGIRLLLAAVLLGTACSRDGASSAASSAASGPALEQGREYTRLLYARDYDRLWGRFSPELRHTFASAADLSAFAGRTVDVLGPERGAVEEKVTKHDGMQVYSRTAAFEKAPGPVLVQWTLADSGVVTGFLIRPDPESAKDSTAQ